MKFGQQTEAVYAAEDVLTICNVGLDTKNMGYFLETVLQDPRWVRKWKRKTLGIVFMSANARYARAVVRRGRPFIILGRLNRQRNMHLILHEIAHLMISEKDGHNKKFCRTLLYLVHKYAGAHYQKALRKRFIETGALGR